MPDRSLPVRPLEIENRRFTGHGDGVKMAFMILPFAVLGPAFALTVGETYEQVVAEKGAPVGTSSTGSVRILTYRDAIVRLKDDAVVSFRAPDKAPPAANPAYATAARPRPAAADLDGPAVWETDFGTAMDQARARKCRVLILFTGSDWCPWCKKMDAEVYSQPEFARYSREKLVLLKLDYPEHTPQPDELKAQNAEMRDRYGVRGFPQAVIVDMSGRIVTRVKGYQQGGPARFIQLIQSQE
jgi:thiol-disulfide isomerase/thioredoxin